MDDFKIIDQLVSQEWEFTDSDTRYLTHSIHRYSGKYIPQIPKKLIDITTNPNSIILDPFTGSGTTLLESVLSKRHSIGFDLSPVAILISKVKTTIIEQSLLDDKIHHINTEIRRIISQRKDSMQTTLVPIKEYESKILQDEWFTKWFQLPVLKELVQIKDIIECEDDERIRNLFLVAFSNILRRVSNAHPSYPNVMYNKSLPKRQLPSELVLREISKIANKVKELQNHLNQDYQPRIEVGDARNLPLSDSSIDAIITHPPYIGSVPYAEYQLLSLKWLGYDPKDLDNCLIGGRRQKKDVVSRFYEDMRKALSEIIRVGKAQSLVSIVIGNPVVRGKQILIDEFILEESQNLGMKVIKKIERGKYNTRASKMSEEYILVLRNP